MTTLTLTKRQQKKETIYFTNSAGQNYILSPDEKRIDIEVNITPPDGAIKVVEQTFNNECDRRVENWNIYTAHRVEELIAELPSDALFYQYKVDLDTHRMFVLDSGQEITYFHDKYYDRENDRLSANVHYVPDGYFTHSGDVRNINANIRVYIEERNPLTPRVFGSALRYSFDDSSIAVRWGKDAPEPEIDMNVKTYTNKLGWIGQVMTLITKHIREEQIKRERATKKYRILSDMFGVQTATEKEMQDIVSEIGFGGWIVTVAPNGEGQLNIYADRVAGGAETPPTYEGWVVTRVGECRLLIGEELK